MFCRIVAEYSKAIVPTGALCMVNCQSLAGYVATGQLGTGKKNDQNTPDFETWLINLDALVSSCSQCHIDAQLVLQIFQALMHNICSQSLNIMLAGRDYCNWRRGMQIQYNISRILEWTRDSLILPLYPCQSPRTQKKTHDYCSFERAFEPLLQAAKLVQLSGELFADFEAVVGNVASQLNPAQIVRIMSQIEHVDQQVVVAFARANAGTAGGEIYREWEKIEWKCEMNRGLADESGL
jgi:myosin-5